MQLEVKRKKVYDLFFFFEELDYHHYHCFLFRNCNECKRMSTQFTVHFFTVV
ncbi:hypothetical protein BDF21DRAFT_405668 [Thamnidium elegans]|nr:hypothetical protein BDF21DRAFT_405668 [Thamnidium elegans]